MGGNYGNAAGANIIARFYVGSSSSEGQTGIMSVDETNIYIDWTENGSASYDNMSFLWEAN
jgi:hypothetical protein